MTEKETLIATLGTNPQIVTICLDLLTQKGHIIQEVVTVYTDEPEVCAALRTLETELQQMKQPHHRVVLVGGETNPISDFRIKADVTALMKTLYREIRRCKTAGQRIHLLIAGGRKVMSAYALVVAQLLFDRDDCAWHLFSNWKPGDAVEMHAGPGSGSTLVPVPVIPVTPTSKAAIDLVIGDDPWQMFDYHQTLQQQEQDRKLGHFLRSLHGVKQEVARLLAEGLNNEAIAARRNKSIYTVNKQVSDIFAEWRVFWGLPEDAPVRDQIVAELSGYFARKGGG